jgi:site-specific recombinase XerD
MFTGAQLARLFSLAGVTPESVIHRGQAVVLLHFQKERDDLCARVKARGGRWSQTHRCWYLPRDRRLLEGLLADAGFGLAQLYPEAAAGIQNMQRQIGLKGYSPATKRNYVQAFTAFILHFDGRNPEEIDKRSIEDYLLHLTKERRYSESSVHGVMNAIKFYYEAVLRRPKEWFDVYRPKKPEQNPRFFNKEEVAAILNATANLKHKAILMLCYSAGLRVSEVVGLRVRQVDSKRMCLYIEGAKGKKDRIAPLSTLLLVLLREYARQYRPADLLFEGEKTGSAYSTRSVQMILDAAKKKAGVLKPGSVHALRHSFATHLLDKGTDVTMIQKLLGHNDIKTTLRYLHVTNRDLLDIRSPLDDLDLGQKAK